MYLLIFDWPDKFAAKVEKISHNRLCRCMASGPPGLYRFAPTVVGFDNEAIVGAMYLRKRMRPGYLDRLNAGYHTGCRLRTLCNQSKCVSSFLCRGNIFGREL